MHRRGWICLVLLVCGVGVPLAPAPGGLPGVVGARALPPWAHGPLKVTTNKRFLEHANGQRFEYLADTAWGLFARLNREEVDLYMQDTAAKGFTVVMAVGLWLNSRKPNAYGDHPMAWASTGKYDPTRILTTPGSNPSIRSEYDYWDHVDYVISKAEEHGLYVAFLPTWGYYVCCTTTYGTNTGSIIFNADTARAYGRFVGQRYATRPNIIWVNGGDRAAVYGTRDYRPVWRALAEGVGSGVTGQTLAWHAASPGWDKLLMTFHPMRRIHGSSLWFHDDPWLDFNGIETDYDDIVSKITIDWQKQPTRPTALLEARYEGTNALDGKPFEGAYGQRFQQYHTMFSGALGFAYGHARIYNFFIDGLDKPWYVALDDPGRSQMQHLLGLLRGLTPAQWLGRIPDPTLVDGPLGTLPDEDYVAAMRGSDGDIALAYSTNGRDIRLNVAKLRSGVADAHWFNPRTGVLGPSFATVATGAGAGAAVFNPPGSPGYDNDWALKVVLRSPTTTPTPTPTPAPRPAPTTGTATASCPVTEDTAIRSGLTGAGSLGTISTGGSTTAPTYSLWRFSLSCVPAGKTILKATVRWMVYQDSGRSVNQFDLYQVKRAWTERSATWTYWTGTSPWARAGAEDSAADRGATVLGSVSAGAADVASGAWINLALNAAGVQLLQSWRAGAIANDGFLLKAASGTDTLRVRSSETGAGASRPRIDITYEP